MIVTLQQGVGGYTGNTDNWITDWNGSFNWGATTEILVGLETGFGKCRILQRWDLSSISPGAICTAASLQLYDLNYAGRTLNTPINIYQISAANASWVAGTADGATQVGSSDWNDKERDVSIWAGSVGLNTPGTDYVNTSLAAYTFLDGGSGYKTIDFNPSGLAYLQSLFGTTGGAGFLIIGDEVNSNSLSKLDSANGTNTPKLQITLADGESSGLGRLGIAQRATYGFAA